MYSDDPKNSPVHTRRVALQILRTVLNKKQPLDQALEHNSSFHEMEESRDRAFTRMLVTTTIRRLGQIDDVIKHALARPDQDISPPDLLNILRIGATQILFMDVPDHAAVDVTVSLAEKSALGRKKGFVNAILRNITRDGKIHTTKQDIPRLNTPEWMLKHFINDYGLRVALEIAQANIAESPIDLTLKNRAETDMWHSNLGGTLLPTGSLRLAKGGRVEEIAGYAEGAWWVQDAAAALPATLFGENIKGQRIADLCAAPGGKTAQLAALGADVLALDRSARRLIKFGENMERLGFTAQVKTEAADASVWTPKEALDGVLLDAPCTASGTLRKRPDVGWLKNNEDLDSLKATQARLLANAAIMLKEGGTLIYCTCSLFKDEGERQIHKFLKDNPDFKRNPIAANEIGGLTECISDEGDVRILPTHMPTYGGMDGFYISRLVKSG